MNTNDSVSKKPVAIIVLYGVGYPPVIVWEWMDV